MNCLRLSTLLLLTLGLTAFAATTTRPITPQDLWAMKRLGSPALAPDGRTVAFTVQEWSIEKNKSTSNLWLVDTAGGTPRRLTTAQVSDGAPAWSPDGTRIAFTSKRGDDENHSLYVMRPDGGEPEKILELPYAVTAPKWLPDGRGIVVATRVIPGLAGRFTPADLAAMKKEIKRRKDSKVSARVSEDRAFRYWDQWLTDNLAHRLLLVDPVAKQFRDLTPGFDRLFILGGEPDFDVAPDGGAVVVTINSTPPPYRDYPNNDLYLVPTDGSGRLRNLTPENPGGDTGAVFAPDGRTLLFRRLKSPYHKGEFAKLWRHDLATGQNTPITDHLDHAFGNVTFSTDGDTLWLTAEDRGCTAVFRLNADGSGFTAVHRSGSSGSLRTAGGSIIFLNNNHRRPDELFALDAKSGAVRQLTAFNTDVLAQLECGRVEEYWFDGAAGDRVQGWLYLPPGFDPAKSYPLVQLMHGGPHTMAADSWSYRWNGHVMAAPGYVVTWVNRHGSTGFGEKFAQSILGEWGDKPLEDILKGTEYLLARFPNIDPKRLAAAGASYGGYMAAWVAGHTDRFACIINHAGVSDFIAQYGADITSYGFSNVLGGNPWDNPEGMQRNNPTTYARNFKTPMLIIHGEKDYRVPYINGTALYGIYQAMGLSARLVIFPDENHWILTPQNAIYWNWEVQSWLSRHIGGQPVLEKPEFSGETK
jgi:dipeptidyl aminopeptidase/acylaminoacyl peptidase